MVGSTAQFCQAFFRIRRGIRSEFRPAEILEFCDRFRREDTTTPLVVVPTSFNSITEQELSAHGVNIVIYANQLMRAAVPAMKSAAEEILRHHRAQEIDEKIMPFQEIISLIDEL